MRRLAIAAPVVAVLMGGASSASAQNSNFALVDSGQPPRLTGWVFTPGIAYQGAWDDNALLIFDPAPPEDFLSSVNPRGTLTYIGRRSEFDASYDGSWMLYRQLSALNSYDQHLTTGARRLLTPHMAIWVHNAFVKVPTTELLNFVAVPFIRTGSKLDDLKGGIDVDLTKATSLTAGYTFQWITFGDLQPNRVFYRGGHSHGLSAALKHQLNETTALTANYNVQHAIVITGSTFDVQNADAGFEKLVLPETRVYAAFGFSRLGLSDFGPTQIGPAWRAGVTHRLNRTALTLTYARSYVPAFAFGGTFQNEELLAQVHAPLARRVYVRSSFSWRRNDPLELTRDLKLKSIWFEATAGYALAPWAQIEGFYSAAHQEIDRPGGIVGRNRIGFQIVTSKPMRIR